MLNIDKHSQIARIFSALLSDVLFQIQEGEKERVYEHLKKMGEVDPERKTYKRSYWRRMAMYSCPDPITIVEGLFDIYVLFKDMDDPMMTGEQNRKVLVPNALKILETEMWYVQRGLLSDLPGMQMYFKTRKLPTTGFQELRCVRSTSGLEGMHLHYRASQHPCAKGSGVFGMNVRGKLFIWGWNVKAAVRAGLMPDLGHTDVWRADQIINALHGLPSECLPPYLRSMNRTRTDLDPLTTIGVQFDELGIVGKQLHRLPSNLLRPGTAEKLAASEDAIQLVCGKDLAALARVFEVYTSVKHCEQALQLAQETVRTDQALQGCLRAVHMRVRKTCERIEPGVQPARSPDRGPATTMAVHFEHDTQGAQRMSVAARLTVRFGAPADHDGHNEGTDESHAEWNNHAAGPPRSTEPQGDELGASRHSEAGDALSEQPEKARKKPRLMTAEERAEHKREQSRQRAGKRRETLRAAPGAATPATVATSSSSRVGDSTSGNGGDGAL
jgi:hypothetical protein